MVGVNKPKKNLFEDLNKHEIDMIWAEAMHFYKKGEKYSKTSNRSTRKTLRR